jgi:hypothetical protein
MKMAIFQLQDSQERVAVNPAHVISVRQLAGGSAAVIHLSNNTSLAVAETSSQAQERLDQAMG